MRESSNASNPHSYGESFSGSGLRGPSTQPIVNRARPKTVASPRKIKIGKYCDNITPTVK
jgi:hypothetical protein